MSDFVSFVKIGDKIQGGFIKLKNEKLKYLSFNNPFVFYEEEKRLRESGEILPRDLELYRPRSM